MQHIFLHLCLASIDIVAPAKDTQAVSEGTSSIIRSTSRTEYFPCTPLLLIVDSFFVSQSSHYNQLISEQFCSLPFQYSPHFLHFISFLAITFSPSFLVSFNLFLTNSSPWIAPISIFLLPSPKPDQRMLLIYSSPAVPFAHLPVCKTHLSGTAPPYGLWSGTQHMKIPYSGCRSSENSVFIWSIVPPGCFIASCLLP